LPGQAVHVIGAAANADHWAINARGDRAKIAVHCRAMVHLTKKRTLFLG
jgi:hypothetical protein